MFTGGSGRGFWNVGRGFGPGIVGRGIGVIGRTGLIPPVPGGTVLGHGHAYLTVPVISVPGGQTRSRSRGAFCPPSRLLVGSRLVTV